MIKPTWIAALVLIIFWIIGLWKAVELWSPRFSIAESIQRTAADTKSILPKLFWICNGLILIGAGLQIAGLPEIFRPVEIAAFGLGITGLIALEIHVDIMGMVEPRLIRLTARHKLKTREGYEDVLYWTCAYWVFEKPLAVSCAWILFGLGLLHMLLADGPPIISIVGVFVVFGLWGICRYTTLVVKRDGVTIHRWLSRFPTTRIPIADITDVRVDIPIAHRFFGVSRLTITDSEHNEHRVALKEPTRALECIDQILISE